VLFTGDTIGRGTPLAGSAEKQKGECKNGRTNACAASQVMVAEEKR
jgi:hypothetical protein